jgi:hypothetical protein
LNLSIHEPKSTVFASVSAVSLEIVALPSPWHEEELPHKKKKQQYKLSLDYNLKIREVVQL